MPKTPIDPAKAVEKMHADMAKMHVGPRDGSGKARRQLLTKAFGLASFRFDRWSAELDETQTLQDALEPTFWASLVETIRGHDKTKGRGGIIEVRKLDIGLYAELMIIEIGTGFVKVVLLRQAQEPDVILADDCPLIPKWNAGKKVHEVIRKDDGQVMRSDFQTKASAAAWIADHMKKMAA